MEKLVVVRGKTVEVNLIDENNKLEKIIDLLLNHVYQPSCNQSTQSGQLVVDLEDSDGNCLGGLVLNGINEDDLEPFKNQNTPIC